ncbi:unnamed protein product [Kuraishia capsulata CBS 1993]|uniref:Uncharacterized protein n=1 Tax=Kuraishia capsulata CBS 1993 TaxID=1382522 RepID=W6MT03_9ASCO|nr:uncharacterized protein KUCA_T00005848001 [Kuraishia capsulata CBS 1993]CDK29854.1 unnamed protein product [Kuraishia capsulata CBS 1993]
MSRYQEKVLNEAHLRDKAARDKLLSTPLLMPTSPLITPPSVSKESRDDFVQRFNLKAQDADHTRRFERFLNLYNITKEHYRKYERSATDISSHSRKYNMFPDSDDEYEESADEDREIWDEPEDEYAVNDSGPSFKVHGEYMCTDLDNFYDSDSAKLEDEIAVLQNDDSDFYYRRMAKVSISGEQEEDDIVKRQSSDLVGIPSCQYLPVDSSESFFEWESHSPTDRKEIFENLGIYNPINEKYLEQNETGAFAFSAMHSMKFRDSLKMSFHSQFRSEVFGENYRSNVIAYSPDNRALYVGDRNCIKVWQFGTLNRKESFKTIRFEYGGMLPEASMTAPYDARTINFLKISQLNGKEVLIAAIDEGRVMIWNTGDLDYTSDQNRAYELQLSSSVWGLDVYPEYDLLVVSDNSQTVTLVYVDVANKRLHAVSSAPLLYNVPSVCFVKNSPKKKTEGGWNVLEVEVAVASISSEVVVLKFRIRQKVEPENSFLNDCRNGNLETLTWVHRALQNHPEHISNNVILDPPHAVARSLLSEDAWTISHVNLSAFKKVISLPAMTGNQFLHQASHLKKISLASKFLDVESDPCISGHLGIGATLAHFDIPCAHTVPDGGVKIRSNLASSPNAEEGIMNISDAYRRRRKLFDTYYVRIQRAREKSHLSSNGKLYWGIDPDTSLDDGGFLLVTTTTRVALLRKNRLVCNASSGEIFPYMPDNPGHSNRISMSLVIPELSAFVVGTEKGQLAILRLTQYRGCYGFRHEYVFPGPRMAVPISSRMHVTLLGFSAVQLDESELRYLLTVIYTDGRVLEYEIMNDELARLRVHIT